MGGKHRVKRHQGLVYIAAITLILFSFSGCTQISRSFNITADTQLQQELAAIEEMINNKDFQAASTANLAMLKKNQNSFKPGDTVTANYLIQARINQRLLAQTLSDQEQKASLFKRIQQDKDKQKRERQSVQAFKEEIHGLNKKIKTLEKEKSELEKQIERMKQIDLNKDSTPKSLQ
ncbi:MAG: hypothetical protein MI862_05590 [Desulfobacterales bacterium]|nr:hypothetical protein [Desulfobacterales bacterium]